MRVAGIRLYRVRVPFRAPYVTAAGSAMHREAVLCELTTDGGIVGIGEASLLPYATSPGDSFWREVQEVAAKALGRPLADLSAGPGRLIDSSAAAGIEIAAWDALARISRHSVALDMYGEVHQTVPVNVLVSKPAAVDAALAARAAVAAGFGTVKLKVGMANSVAEEVQRVEAVRRAIGPGVRLRIDANGSWSEEQAIETLRALSGYDLEYVEQPIASGNLAALKRVRDAVTVTVAADEDVYDVGSAIQVLKAEAAGLIVLKPLTLGGIGITQNIGAQAKNAGAEFTVTTSIDFGIGTAVALHLAVAMGGRAAGLATLDLLENSLIREDLPIVDGCMKLPDAPGLGVTLDMDAVDRYTVASATFVAP